MVTGNSQGRLSIRSLQIDIGVAIEQNLNYLTMAICRGEMQWRK
jgi:hypothetical protein